MSYKPKFERGDSVRISSVKEGHDNHDPKKPYKVLRVYPGRGPKSTGYFLAGSSSVWPETRLERQ